MMSKTKKLKLGLFFLLSFTLVFCAFFVGNFGFNKDEFASAETTWQEYEISNTSSGGVSAKNASTLETKSFKNFSELFNFLESEQSNLDESITLNFKNFVFKSGNAETQLVLERPNGNYKFTGSLKTISNLPAVVIKSVKKLELCNFSVSSGSDYSIYLEKCCPVTFSGNISYNTNFFSNFVSGNFTFTAKENLTVSKKIKIVCSYDLFSSIIVEFEDLEKSQNLFELCKAQNNFDLYSDYSKVGSVSGKLVASSWVYWNFDSNGGEFDSSLSDYPIFRTNYYKSFSFPSSSLLKKDYSNFVGWFGTFSYNGKTYYFDSEMLKNAPSKLEDASENLERYFATSLDGLALDKAFTGFYFNADESQAWTLNKHKYFFLDNGLTPKYIASWHYKNYDLKFDSNTDEIPNTILSLEYNSQIVTPSLSRIGYEFLGWFNEKEGLTPFEFANMPGQNLVAYAKWKVLQFNLNFETNGGSNIETLRIDYGSNLSEPSAPTKQGYEFLGWFTDSSLETPFDFSNKTMPASDFTLYAKWSKIRLNVYYDLVLPNAEMVGDRRFRVDYGERITPPVAPTCIGKTFVGWYVQSSYQTVFDFNSDITKNTTLFARWEDVFYSVNFVTGNGENIESLSLRYGEKVDLPENLVFENHKFVGWFTDSELTKEYTNNTMGASDLTLYAKWAEKTLVQIKTDVQNYNFGDGQAKFKNFSELDNFEIYYLVNGVWQIVVPTELGTYDVKITRAEDSNYASFEQIVEKGLVVSPNRLNLGWVIAILYLLTLVEILVAIYVRHLKNMKISKTYAIMVGTSFIPTSQVVQLVISGILFVAGFVYLIYEIVQTHNTANNVEFDPSDKDTRERFKDDLVFQTNIEIDPNYEYKVKTEESFGDKYSNEDIEKMMVTDNYEANLKSKEKAQQAQKKEREFEEAKKREESEKTGLFKISKKRKNSETYERDSAQNKIDLNEELSSNSNEYQNSNDDFDVSQENIKNETNLEKIEKPKSEDVVGSQKTQNETENLENFATFNDFEPKMEENSDEQDSGVLSSLTVTNPEKYSEKNKQDLNSENSRADELKNENPQTDSALKNENLKEQNDASENSSQNLKSSDYKKMSNEELERLIRGDDKNN